MDAKDLAKKFAHALQEELEAESWGSVEPEWFGAAFASDYEPGDEDYENVKSLEGALVRAAAKVVGEI